MAKESFGLAELIYAISAAWDVRKLKHTAKDRANLNEYFPRSKSVLPCAAGLPQLEVQDNLQKEGPKAYLKGGLLFRENRTTTCSHKG